MNIINATNALQSATKLKKYLGSKGHDIPQSVLKEALAHCLNFGSSNEMDEVRKDSFDHMHSSFEIQQLSLLKIIDEAHTQSYFNDGCDSKYAEIFFCSLSNNPFYFWKLH